MERAEVIELLERVDSVYQNKFKPRDLGLLIEEWVDALADADAETINARFKKYIKANEWPPTVANLLGIDGGTRTQVKSYEETKAFLTQYENRTPADPKVVAEEKAKIRKLLGMDGEQDE